MATFVDEFMKSLGPQVAQNLASNLKIDPGVATQMLPQVIPMILGGLKNQKDNFGGDARVDHILNKYGSADVLKDIGGLFAQKAKDKTADPKLGGLLGEAGIQATNMLSQNYGLKQNVAAKLIPMLAPIVLGALTKKRDQGGLGSTGIASLLDQDGDGSILDDVAGFLMKGLAGGGAGTQGAGNVLGSLLGGLFGKKR
jgi:hypothetical protein